MLLCSGLLLITDKPVKPNEMLRVALPKGIERFHLRNQRPYCWIARGVMAAMLVVKKQLNFIVMQILLKKIVLFWQPTWPPCHVSEIKELV